MTRRLLTIATILLIVGLVVIFVATPYVRAASLVVRAANLGGRAEAYADEYARPVTVEPSPPAGRSRAGPRSPPPAAPAATKVPAPRRAAR